MIFDLLQGPKLIDYDQLRKTKVIAIQSIDSEILNAPESKEFTKKFWRYRKTSTLITFAFAIFTKSSMMHLWKAPNCVFPLNNQKAKQSKTN